jgi:GT2 family glycosyltransferase
MLLALLEDLNNQSYKPEGIVVVDNGSVDGTVQDVRKVFPSVHLIELKNNVGLFGGLEAGINIAIQREFDAVWLVDDDARLRGDTVECLIRAIEQHKELRNAIIWCANISPEGQFFTEPVCVNVKGEWRIYHKLLPELEDKIYETTGGPNIGVYIPRTIIENVGTPSSDTVFCGEEEFNFRVKQAGYKLFRCFESIIYHKRHNFYEIQLKGRTRYISKAPPWHTYYEIRNRIFVDLTYGRRTVVRSLLNTAIDSAIKIYICENKISTAIHILRAIYDGLHRNMGMRVNIPRLIHNNRS